MGEEWPIGEVFDADYLHFYLSHMTDADNDAEAALVHELLGVREGAEVLDLACGHGRIANRLAAKGLRVTGLDAMPAFLDIARRDAELRGVVVDYVEGDMRAIPWTERFEAVVSWFTAFGYFDDAQNRGVLAGVHEALRPGGSFLVELNHKDGLLSHWLPSSVHEVGGAVLIDQRVYDPLTGRSHARRTIIKDGRARESRFFTRLFSYTELRDWLLDAGFREVSGCAGDGSPLTPASRRMILLAKK